MRMKFSDSSCSIVPTVTPRDRCERNFTHSNTVPGSRSKCRSRSMRLNSSQVWLVVSHSSVVIVPRTARAFSRAAFRHDTMLDACVSSPTMKFITRRGSILPWRCS